MSTMMIALLAAFTQADGCCAPKQDVGCCTESVATVGKHTERRVVCVKPSISGKVQVEVKAEDRQPGDVEGTKTIGKHTEKAWYRWVDVPKPAEFDCAKAASKDSCSVGVFTVDKQTVQKSFCVHGGERMFCGRGAGECASCLN